MLFKAVFLAALFSFLKADCPAPTSCPDNWVYEAVTNACYYLKNFTSTNGKTWDTVDVSEAELRCRQMNLQAHLVSIHDALENQIIYDLLKTTNLRADPKAPTDGMTCSTAYAWTGLSYNPTRNFSWTDGTIVDWQPPVYLLSGTTYYGMMNDDGSCGKSWGSFSDYSGAPLRARYVCKLGLA